MFRTLWIELTFRQQVFFGKDIGHLHNYRCQKRTPAFRCLEPWCCLRRRQGFSIVDGVLCNCFGVGVQATAKETSFAGILVRTIENISEIPRALNFCAAKGGVSEELRVEASSNRTSVESLHNVAWDEEVTSRFRPSFLVRAMSRFSSAPGSGRLLLHRWRSASTSPPPSTAASDCWQRVLCLYLCICDFLIALASWLC
jgi:hypothetical protein